jgi:hypothetical protein
MITCWRRSPNHCPGTFCNLWRIQMAEKYDRMNVSIILSTWQLAFSCVPTCVNSKPWPWISSRNGQHKHMKQVQVSSGYRWPGPKVIQHLALGWPTLPYFPGSPVLELIFFYPPGSRIDLLFLPYISLSIKSAKFKLYIIPAKYIPI